MAHPYYHAKSSARKYGGDPDDYVTIHAWFDQTKAHLADCRHRMLLHNSFGIFLCEQQFGKTFTRQSDGKPIPTRLIAEQHVLEDFGGRIPTLEECLRDLPIAPWMSKGARALSQQFDQEEQYAVPSSDNP
jgi:hypothetical protein